MQDSVTLLIHGGFILLDSTFFIGYLFRTANLCLHPFFHWLITVFTVNGVNAYHIISLKSKVQLWLSLIELVTSQIFPKFSYIWHRAIADCYNIRNYWKVRVVGYRPDPPRPTPPMLEEYTTVQDTTRSPRPPNPIPLEFTTDMFSDKTTRYVHSQEIPTRFFQKS